MAANESLLTWLGSECWSLSSSHAGGLTDEDHRLGRMMPLLAAAAVVVATVATGATGVSRDNTITRFAGVPKRAFGGFSGDGGPALRAELSVPVGLAVDGQGNVYLADRNNNRVRKVSTSGIITTFAGGGSADFPTYGDGGPATSARLNYPWGVAADRQGNVYFSERSNNRVRKVDTSGIISTFAGGVDAGPPTYGDGGPATSARLFNPQGLVLDSQGNLYISDYLSSRIRKVSRSGVISHCRRWKRVRILRRRRPSHRGEVAGARGAGHGSAGEPLHRRPVQRSHPQGEHWRDDHDRRRRR